MASSSLFRHLSFDRVSVAVTMAGCFAVLLDADRQGREPMQASLPASQGGASGSIFSQQQCRKLENEGYLVIDNFLSQQQVKEACQAIQELDQTYKFQGSPNERENVDLKVSQTRTHDRVLINRTGTLDLVRQQVGLFARKLIESDFQGFASDDYKTGVLYMPGQMQVSICGGQEDEDNTTPSTHNFYNKHLDSAGANNLLELGIVGWLKSQHLRRRYLTCIVYLNQDWKEGDGGCLRVFSSGDKDENNCFVDIAPLAGRMIVFSSSSQVHVVLPSRVQRYACAVWLQLLTS